MMAASRSKDPSTQNGACVVNKENIILGVGYNGFVRGIKDTPAKWERDVKHTYVSHAERNALHNCTVSPKGATLYLWSSKNYLPCLECTKSIIQSGIKRLKVLDMPKPTKNSMGEINPDKSTEIARYNWNESLDLLKKAGITFICNSDYSSKKVLTNNKQIVRKMETMIYPEDDSLKGIPGRWVSLKGATRGGVSRVWKRDH